MEERFAETDGRSADGFESRTGRGFGERDAGPTGGVRWKWAVAEGRKEACSVPGEALDGNGGGSS
jgi:hypothetical protein